MYPNPSQGYAPQTPAYASPLGYAAPPPYSPPPANPPAPGHLAPGHLAPTEPRLALEPGWGGPPGPAFELVGPPPAAMQEFEAPPPVAASPVLPPPSTEMVLEPSTYRFFNPGYWFPRDGWNNSFEIGINGSTGNAESTSLRTGAHIERKLDPSKFTLDIKYARTLAEEIETQHNALLNSNVESTIGGSLWSTFYRTSLEYDEFKAFDIRAAMNIGVGYHLIKSDATNFLLRFGSGVSRELGGPDDRYVPEAVYGLEFDRQLTKRQKLYATVDYFPDWTDYSDYRVVTNAGWEFLLDDLDNISLKLGAVDRYDSTPNGRNPNDLDYSLLLLWKR